MKQDHSRPKAFAAKPRSKLAAIEAVCRQVGLTPVYPTAETVWNDKASARLIQFQREPRPYPVSFAGPFMLEVAALEENVPHGTGELVLRARAFGVTEAVAAGFPSMLKFFAVDEIRGPDGENLHGEEGVQWYSTPEVDAEMLTEEISVDLRHLLRNVGRH